MRQNIQNRKQEGFTIIEVLIVLAIAGLIMIVVFLAVPALQRNSRNSQTRTEANNLLSAAQEINSNKGGAGLVTADATSVKDAANTSNITTFTIASGVASLPAAATTTATLRTSANCTAQNAAPAGGTARQSALVYWVETAGNGTQIQCLNM